MHICRRDRAGEIGAGLMELAAAVRSAGTPPSVYKVPADLVARIRDGDAVRVGFPLHADWTHRPPFTFSLGRAGDQLTLRFYDDDGTPIWTLILDGN